MNNNVYARPYVQSYNPVNQQNVYDQIDNQIGQLQQMKEHIKNSQQPAINQTFQLAPTTNNGIKYANTINDVEKEFVYLDTPFFSPDMSILWIKSTKGDIKSYELSEIIPKDAKDIQIEYLQSQIEELKGMIKNDANVTNVNAEQDATNTTRNVDSVGTTIKKNESTSIPKVSRSKEK